MSRTPPSSGDIGSESLDTGSTLYGAAGRWGTVSGGLRSPPPAPSSGASVRRNHTIHGARQHDKPRLEKHFEQPEDLQNTSSPGSQQGASSSTAHSARQVNGSPHSSSLSIDALSSPSSQSEATSDLLGSLTPLQALYSKSAVHRNHSLPSRHSSKIVSNLPPSATQGRSSVFNSLSAITGGSDLDEHDWEKLIHSDNALGDDHVDHSDPAQPSSAVTDSAWSDSVFNHRRFPSGSTSAQPTSPLARTEFLIDSHTRSGSATAMDAIDNPSFASPPMAGSAGFIRRHQSLNHHSGRAAADRLAARSSNLLFLRDGLASGPGTGTVTPTYSAHLDQAFSPVGQTASLSAANSPVVPSNYSKPPWNQPPQGPIGSPSRFAASFPSNNLDGSHTRMGSGLEASSSSLLELQSGLAKLDVSGSVPLTAGDSSNSRDTATPTGPGKNSASLPMRPVLSSHHSASDIHHASGGRTLPSLITNPDVLQPSSGTAASTAPGPASAAAFVPPIGHGHSRNQSNDPSASVYGYDTDSQRFGPFSAAPGGTRQDRQTTAGRFGGISRPGPLDPTSWQQQPFGGATGSGSLLNTSTEEWDPNMLALSMALVQEQQKNALLRAQLGAQQANVGAAGSGGVGQSDAGLYGMNPMNLQGQMQSIGQQLRGPQGVSPHLSGMGNLSNQGKSPFLPHQSPSMQFGQLQAPGIAAPPSETPEKSLMTSVDPTLLAREKGYNPPLGTFDLVPPSARFFVIKSYTEDDVHKSLKYEIWASTDKGNQRLDKAFRESAHLGPIYLFYSVNASGHFCGMAQMLTPLDYTTSSNVWAQDGKWKGTFKVRWIYVKDLPNNQLRHIRLTNTPECKPVTQSRDTQELTPEAGREVLRIMAEYTPKTSLLQDFNFYEMQGKGPSQQQMPLMPKVGSASQSPALGAQAALKNSPRTTSSPSLSPVRLPLSPNLGLAGRNNGLINVNNEGRRTPQRQPHGAAVGGLGFRGSPSPGPGAAALSHLYNGELAHSNQKQGLQNPNQASTRAPFAQQQQQQQQQQQSSPNDGTAIAAAENAGLRPSAI